MRQKGLKIIEWNKNPLLLATIRVLTKFFLLKNKPLLWRMPWEYFTVILYSPYHSCEGIFFTFHPENLVRLLEGTSMKLWALVKLSSLHFLTCMLVHAYLPSIQQNYHLSVPTSLWLWWLFITLEAPVLQISGQQIIL